MKKNVNELLKENTFCFFDSIKEINYGTVYYSVAKCLVGHKKDVQESIYALKNYLHDYSEIDKEFFEDGFEYLEEDFKFYMSLIDPKEFNLDMFYYFCSAVSPSADSMKDCIIRYIYLYLIEKNILEIEQETLDKMLTMIDFKDKEQDFSNIERIVNEVMLTNNCNTVNGK